MIDVRLPARPKDGHKGTFGTVAIFGGHISDDSVMLGSAAFAGKAAVKVGVGLVDFVGEKQVLIELINMLPQAVGHTYENFGKLSAQWSSIIVGPGWENNGKNLKVLKDILKLKKPTVIDGEALNMLAAKPDLLELVHQKCVLTPHVGEFERLSKATGLDKAQTFAEQHGCVLVLKSSIIKLAEGNNYWEHEGNNPVLATGGTGDVLSGIIGGLLAQKHIKLTTFETSKISVQLHDNAAKKWARTTSGNFLIDNLIGNIF